MQRGQWSILAILGLFCKPRQFCESVVTPKRHFGTRFGNLCNMRSGEECNLPTPNCAFFVSMLVCRAGYTDPPCASFNLLLYLLLAAITSYRLNLPG